MLRGALLETPESSEEQYAQARMREMYELMELMTTWFADVRKLSPKTLVNLMELGGKVNKLLEFKEKIKTAVGGKSE